MNLQERITELEGKNFVKKILTIEDKSNSDDVKNFGLSVKHVHFLDVNGAVMVQTKAVLFVLDEGTEKEEAYWDGNFKGGYPVSIVRPQTVQEMEENTDGTVYKVEKLVDTTGDEKVISEKLTLEAVEKESVLTK